MKILMMDTSLVAVAQPVIKARKAITTEGFKIIERLDMTIGKRPVVLLVMIPLDRQFIGVRISDTAIEEPTDSSAMITNHIPHTPRRFHQHDRLGRAADAAELARPADAVSIRITVDFVHQGDVRVVAVFGAEN